MLYALTYVDFDLPEPTGHATGDVAVYVATHLLERRPLFEILTDRFVSARIDEQPYLLDDLARDPVVRGVLSRRDDGILQLAA